MVIQLPLPLLTTDGSSLKEQFSNIRARDLSILYRTGVLRLSDLYDLFKLLANVPHLFRVKYNNRYVRIFAVSNIGSDPDDSDIQEYKQQGFVLLKSPDCELLILRQSFIQREMLDELGRHASLIVHNTLIWRSLQKERLNSLTSDMHRALSISEDLNIDRLALFISRKISVSVALLEKRTEDSVEEQFEMKEMHLKAKPRGHAARTVYVLRNRKRGRFAEAGNEVQETLGEKAEIALRGAKLIEVDSSEIKFGAQRFSRNYVLFPLCRSTEPRSQRNQLFLVSKQHGEISEYDIHIIQELISYYFDHLMRERQQLAITKVVKEISDLHRRPEFELRSMEREYDQITKKILHDVIWSTPAYRCSVWEYLPQFHALSPKIIVGLTGTENDRSKGFFAQDLAVRQFDRSSIVNCFTSALLSDQPVYIGDVRRPDKYVRPSEIKRDLREIVAPSLYTQSEVSVPIFEAATPVGVLYVESRIIDAFNSDLWYFQAMGALLSELRTAQNRKMDSSFVAERLSLFDNLHELGPHIDYILKDQDELRKKLRNFLELDRQETASSIEMIDLNFVEIVASLRAEYSYQLRSTIDEIFGTITIRPNVPVLKCPKHTLTSTRFILKNLISNAFRYRPRGFNSNLIIAFDRARGIRDSSPYSLRAAGTVRVECTIEPSLPFELVQQLGKRSVSQSGRAPRRGLYLVGLVARQLGGTFSAVPSIDGKKTRIVLRIPFAGLEVNRDKNRLPRDR